MTDSLPTDEPTSPADQTATAAELTRRRLVQLLGVVGGAGLGGTHAVGAVAATDSTRTAVGPTLVEKDADAGFNFPYYLYAPTDAREKPLLVEPVNSGAASDDFEEDLDAGRRIVSGGIARRISDTLRVPLVVPVFANPASGEFYERFTQSLDTETMRIDDGRFERLDRQLLAMVDDARARLADEGIDLPPEIMMNGFSASGNFVDNFAVLQPERVSSVTAGAVNGMPTLPIAEASGHTLNYQIGIADLESLTGAPFDLEAWREVALFCYMGADETSPADDTLPYRDVWSREQANKARDVYGDDMQDDRMTYAEMVHDRVDAGTRMEVYDDTGHSYSPTIVSDIIAHHRRHNGIEAIDFREAPTGGSEELAADVFAIAPEAEQLEARVYQDGTELTTAPRPIVPGVTNSVTLPLDAPLTVGGSWTVEVTTRDGSQPILSREGTTQYRLAVVDDPTPGSAALTVEYATADSADRLYMYVIPDGSGPYWQRDIQVTTVHSGASATETFELSTAETGIPFNDGDEVEVWLIPPGNITPSRAVATATATVGSPEAGRTRSASRCEVEQVSHDEVDIGFGARPVGDATSVTVVTSVAESFDQRVRTRLFPESGGGRWGHGLDFIDPGSETTNTYDVPSGMLTLGETATLRAFPQDWGTVDDAIALECTTVSGIEYTDGPMAGGRTLGAAYLLPGQLDGAGSIELRIDGSVSETLVEVPPGEYAERTFTDADATALADGLPTAAEVTLALVHPDEPEPIDTATLETAHEGTGISVSHPPAPYTNAVTLEYSLDERYAADRPAAVRLYTESGNEWGYLLHELEPGARQRVTIGVDMDSIGVPFQPDTTHSVAVVDGDDPFGREALATAEFTVPETADAVETAQATPNGTATRTASPTPTATEAGEAASTATSEPTTTETAATTDSDTPSGATPTTTPGQPGFGILGSLASIGAGIKLLQKRLDASSGDDDEG